jgi:capsular polysaccharide biosynthesis protein
VLSNPICRHLFDGGHQLITPPVNLDPEDSDVLGMGIAAELPPAFVTQLEDARASGNGVLQHDNETRLECFASPEVFRQWKSRRRWYQKISDRIVTQRSVIDWPTIWITDNWSGGYYHWIAEATCRLEMLSQVCDLREQTLLLPEKFKRRKFVLKSLQAFDLGEIRFLNRFEQITCRQILLPSHVACSGNFREEILTKLQFRFRQNIIGTNQCSSPPSKRIYLSRCRAPRRRILNESELIPILQAHGFTVFYPERHDWVTQMQTIAGAEVLVSNHGAGLTNMIAMTPGSRILELRRRDISTPNCFLTMASALDLHYHYQMVDAADPKASVFVGDMTVDVQTFRRTLTAMLDDCNSQSDDSMNQATIGFDKNFKLTPCA